MDLAASVWQFTMLGSQMYEQDENAKKEIININKKVYSRQILRINDITILEERYPWNTSIVSMNKLDTQFDFFFFESEASPIGKKLVEENLENGDVRKERRCHCVQGGH